MSLFGYQTFIYSTPDLDTGETAPPAQQSYDDAPSNAEYYDPQHWQQQEQGESEVRPRIPLIVLAQQNGATEASETSTPRVMRTALSTISERTERTEATPRWRSGMLNTPRPLSSALTSSYGEIIGLSLFLFSSVIIHHFSGHRHFSLHGSEPIDPNFIPVSPSGSALHRLSTYERAPSLPASGLRSTESSPRLPSLPSLPSDPVPSSQGLPSIPDFNSKSSKQAPLPVPPPRQSKLSLLASSRASSVTSRSQSSRSSGIALAGSVKTFPTLRPSAQSARPPNSTVAPTEPGEEVGENAEYFNRTSPAPSSTSSHVRRAIQTALNQEVNDQENSNHSPSRSRAPSDRSKASTPSHSFAATSPVDAMVPTFPDRQAFRPPSKLALLAQAKVDASKAPRLPKPTTEYLTPIANGPTVTTAITTSYQSLYSLTDPSRSPVIPKQYVVPLTNAAGPADTKRSKLAMKIKKANEQQYAEPEEEVIAPSVSPIFSSKPSRVRASPSAFASLLIDDILTPSQDKDKHGASHSQAKEQRKGEKTDGTPGEASVDPHEGHKHRSRRLKDSRSPDLSPPHGFTFDSPSPDDVVLNARHGTSLGQRRKPPLSTQSPGKSHVSK
jgi:hypothetical protein